jgi:hypothetical protein
MTPFLGDTTAPGDRLVAEPAISVGIILADAHLQCMASGVRFALKATSILATGQLRFLNEIRSTDAHEFPDRLRTVVDEARGCLRELADVMSLEAGRLHRQLAALDEAARNLVPHIDNADQPYRRRWKAKI